LILLAFEPDFGHRIPDPFLALCEILVDFPAWQRLSSEKSRSSEEIETIVGDALVALARDQAFAGRAKKIASQIHVETRRQPT
jgi:hypothetical protein